MPKYEEKEKAKGVWEGRDVRFNRVWRGHRFTDEEVEKLLDGEEIVVSGLTSKAGNTYSVKGKLADLEYNGYEYVGFDQTGFVHDGEDRPQKEKASGLWHDPNGEPREVSFNREWGGHRFTDEEVQMLLQGKEITLSDCVSKSTGKSYSVRGNLAEQELNGHTFIGFNKIEFVH